MALFHSQTRLQMIKSNITASRVFGEDKAKKYIMSGMVMVMSNITASRVFRKDKARKYIMSGMVIE